ncbi:MAG: glycosyl hydrolase [Prevotellaceae bacterium]|jgi:hypothetical protein|nr:glycosyl hydrolase [Prevotellaceae bacterium]
MTVLRNKTLLLLSLLAAGCMAPDSAPDSVQALRKTFISPPDNARPGVYWYFMDGNLSKDGITADLESMKEAGIGNVLFLEVNVGVPRGKVDFLSEEWQTIFAHAVSEAKRLGIELTMGSGPGWAGSGGPWVKPEQSMRNIVASDTAVNGAAKFDAVLTVPALPNQGGMGYWGLTDKLSALREAYYRDVCVLAFPTPTDSESRIADIGEKALYWRKPYSSERGVKPYLPSNVLFDDIAGAAIDRSKIIDLTDKLDASGRLQWDVPEGQWTIMRFGMRNNGVVSRPAPDPGLGFECDKFDTTHLNAHFDAYLGTLFRKTAKTGEVEKRGGWTMLHIDSWEMSSQNWSDNFRSEFTKRRGYDPLKCLPVYSGRVVESVEVSERFLWDVRQTAMELVVENYAAQFRKLGERYGLTLSIQPYDMNPAADFNLGAAADVPSCEFWANGYGYNSTFGCTEAASIAHIYGRPVVEAESFTSAGEGWRLYPENVKNQGDWAFCAGINKFVYHTFAHKPFLSERVRPGMTMGPYGVHWDRGQTWWSMSSAYHRYITRCSYLLRQGRTVADILYLNAEGAPHVFTPPQSAFTSDNSTVASLDYDWWNFRHLPLMPDRRGYNFDVCSPQALMEMAEVDSAGNIVFPSGATYRILVLPATPTMTPQLLHKIETLVKNGATIAGNPPSKSPSLTDYPDCDRNVKETAEQMWGNMQPSAVEKIIRCGKGAILYGGKYSEHADGEIYPAYDPVADWLKGIGVEKDFETTDGNIRYTHRTMQSADVYFISNRTDKTVKDLCTFRSTGIPECWDAVTGKTYSLDGLYSTAATNGLTTLPVSLAPAQSLFIVFDKSRSAKPAKKDMATLVTDFADRLTLDGAWEVSFDKSLGGPENVRFDSLADWTQNADSGIKYYSGQATYSKTFDLPQYDGKGSWLLDVGTVRNIARVRLNGRDLGVIWTAPWRVDITGIAKTKDNRLEIDVVNLWANRLIGDEQLPYDGIKDGKFPDWLLNNTPRTSGRITFTTVRDYNKDSPLKPSGLLGPVKILSAKDIMQK